MKESVWQASTGEASSWDCGKEKKSWDEDPLFIKNLINSQGPPGLPRSRIPRSLPKCCFDFQHSDHRIKKYHLNVESLSKNRLIFGQSFTSRRGGSLLLLIDISYIFRLRLLKKGSSEVASPFRPFLFFDLLHHRQIFVQTPGSEGRESKNPPTFCPEHLIKEGVVLLL